MKRFMQTALASFGVLALMLAGCNTSTPTEDTETGDTGTTVEDSVTTTPAGTSTTGEMETGEATSNQ